MIDLEKNPATYDLVEDLEMTNSVSQTAKNFGLTRAAIYKRAKNDSGLAEAIQEASKRRETVYTGLNMPKSLRDKLQTEADKRGLTLTDVIIQKLSS